ncbi:MAG: hypothetical protein ACRDEB_06815 [Chitinophagaceae bacterium]
MDKSFFAYLQQLESMAFFSAYPLLYAVINVLFVQSKKEWVNKLFFLLPYSYALVGTLYLGMQIKNLYPDFSFENIKGSYYQPVLVLWALLSLLFYFSLLAKKPVISLIHSLVFFFFLLRELFTLVFSSGNDKSILKNEMKVYTDSLVLNLVAFIFIVIIYFILTRYRNRIRS